MLETEELDFNLFGKASDSLRSGYEGRRNLAEGKYKECVEIRIPSHDTCLSKYSLFLLYTGSASISTIPKEEFEVKYSDDYLRTLDEAASSTR